jgi:hypothetical protein
LIPILQLLIFGKPEVDTWRKSKISVVFALIPLYNLARITAVVNMAAASPKPREGIASRRLMGKIAPENIARHPTLPHLVIL